MQNGRCRRGGFGGAALAPCALLCGALSIGGCDRTSPVTQRSECLPTGVDFWRVHDGAAASRAQVSVTLVDGDAIFDPTVSLWEVLDWGFGPTTAQRGRALAAAFDGVDCGAFDVGTLCPSLDAELDADLDADVDGPLAPEDPMLLVHHNLCTSTEIRYELAVTLDGEPARLEYAGTGLVVGIDMDGLLELAEEQERQQRTPAAPTDPANGG